MNVGGIPGDANRDGRFNSTDLVQIFQAGKYETGEPATWEEGDWNGDGVFDSSDLIAAFRSGKYEFAPAAVASSILSKDDGHRWKRKEPIALEQLDMVFAHSNLDFSISSAMAHPEFAELDPGRF